MEKWNKSLLIRKVSSISGERIMEILERFDLSPIESSVYIYLAKGGCKSAEELSSNLGLGKKRLYSVMKKLKNKRGFV